MWGFSGLGFGVGLGSRLLRDCVGTVPTVERDDPQ